MAYSNGYDQTAVIAALKDRVGFRQPLGTGAPTLSSAVTTSNSGRYFQDFHALVTVENIKATMPEANASDANLITHLGEIRSAAIMRALNGVFTGMQIIDQPSPLFARKGTDDVAETNASKFVGYEIWVADTADAAVQIDALRVLFDGATTFNIYLFKDGDPVRMWQQSVTTVENTIVETSLSEKILSRGKYYIGYFQDDLGSVKAYRQQVEHWNKQRFFSALPITAPATGATTFNRNSISYVGEPIGLNLEISSFKDHTIQIKKKAAMFDELIGLTMAYYVIEQILYTSRENKTERYLKDQLDKAGIQLDLNGVAPISDSPQVMGLKQRIERELNTVKKSFYSKPKSQVVEVC